MSIRKIKNSWWVDIHYNGRRYRKKSPKNSKAGAQIFESTLRQKLVKGESINLQEKEKRSSLAFEEFAWKWIELYVKTNNKISGVRGKTSVFKTHLIPFFKGKKLNQITSFSLEEYKARTIKKGLCNKTVNNHLSVLNTCLSYAVEWGELDVVPRVRKLKVVPSKFDFLTFEESEMLISKSHGVWKDMIVFALNTGMRYGELRAIRWEHINWEKRLITVKSAFYRDILGTTKSGKERYIPILSSLLNDLLRRKEMRGFVFSDKDGNHLKENLPTRNFKRILEKTTLRKEDGRKIGWHALRHTFASQLAMRGAPLSAIQQLLGHSDIQTTMMYAHLSPSVLEDTIKLLENEPTNHFGQHTVNTFISGQEDTRDLNSLNLYLEPNNKQKTSP